MNNINSNKKELSPEQREELLRALKARFEKNMNRHQGLEWAKVLFRVSLLALLLVGMALAAGFLHYGGPTGLLRRVQVEVAARRSHPAYVPTPLPVAQGGAPAQLALLSPQRIALASEAAGAILTFHVQAP